MWSDQVLEDSGRRATRCCLFASTALLWKQLSLVGVSLHLWSLTFATALAVLYLAPQVTAQPAELPTAQSLQQRRNAVIQDIWTNGYTCLKPEYQPSLQCVQSSLVTPETVRNTMATERQILADSQQALKASQMADSHWRLLGKALDSMMGALINAGTGRGGKGLAAERILSAQDFIDQANAMIARTTYRQQKLREIAEIDTMIVQKDKPIRFSGRSDAGRPSNSPYAF